MTDLRQAAQQVLDAWQTSLYGKPSHQKAVVLAMTNLNIVLQQQAEPVAWEHHAKKLTHWLHCMSYNDSYFGEPAGLVKQVTAELNRLIGTAPPQQQAEPVAWMVVNDAGEDELWWHNGSGNGKPLYTTPPQQQAEPVQEPFGYLWPTGSHPEFRFTQQKRDGADGMPLYTAPPQRKPLTGEQVRELFMKDLGTDCLDDFVCGIRAAEAAHGIKEGT